MQVERYRIILTGWVVSGHHTRDVVAELSRLFRISEEKVRPLLAGEPSIIRRDLTLEKAEHLRNKIEQRGAVCNIKLVMRDEYEDRGFSMESTGILEPDLNMDSTQFVSLTADSVPSSRVKKKSVEQQVIKPVAPAVPKPTKVSASKRQKGRGVIPKVLFAVVIVAVLVGGYLYIYSGERVSDQVPKIFTFSPAKGESPADGKGKVVHP